MNSYTYVFNLYIYKYLICNNLESSISTKSFTQSYNILILNLRFIEYNTNPYKLYPVNTVIAILAAIAVHYIRASISMIDAFTYIHACIDKLIKNN